MSTDKFLSLVLFRGYSPLWWIRKAFLILIKHREYAERKKWKSSEASDENSIRELHREGFSEIKITGARVASVIEYCKALSKNIDPYDKAPRDSEGKDFWRLLIAGAEAKNHPLLLSFASSPFFKNLASDYLGQEALLSNVTLMKSYPTEKNPTHSQLWHLDADDARLVVFYLYVNDVDASSGPFEFIPKSLMKNIFSPRYFRKYGMTDGEIQKYTSYFMPRSLIGASGSMFACDTATTYHRGSRCKSSIRLALAFRYQTFTGLYPFQPLLSTPSQVVTKK